MKKQFLYAFVVSCYLAIFAGCGKSTWEKDKESEDAVVDITEVMEEEMTPQPIVEREKNHCNRCRASGER